MTQQRALPQVILGVTGLRVSAVGLGCSRLGSVLTDTETAVRLVRHAFQQGVTLFDTADIYGQGQSERILGRALGRDRNSITLVTKGGQRFTSVQRIASLAKRPVRLLVKKFPVFRDIVVGSRVSPLPRDYSATCLHRALVRSLRRLNTDYVDLYLLHSPDATEIQRSDSFAMLECAKEKGLIRHWGISCDDPSAVQAALRINGITALEMPLSTLNAMSGPASGGASELSARGIGLIVGQILTSRSEVAPAAKTPKERVTLVHTYPNAAAVIGTTSIRHLDEVISG